MKPAQKFAVVSGLAVSLGLGSLHLPSVAELENKSSDAAKSISSENVTSAVKVSPKTFADIDSRYVRIEHRLVEASTAGRLTADDAGIIKEELERVAEAEAIFRSSPSKLTKWQNIQLGYQLDKIARRLTALMNDRNVASVDMTFAKEDTLTSIETAAKDGRLSAVEAESLKKEYDRLCAVESSLRKRQGYLSYADKLMLCVGLDHLAVRLRKDMSERPVSMPDVTAECSLIESKIDQALESGKISQKAAEEYRQGIARLKEHEQRYKKGNSVPQTDETIAVGLALEAMANQLLDQIGEGIAQSINVTSQLALLDVTIGGALQVGRLNVIEALELKEDLDAIAGEMAKLPADNADSKAIAGLRLDLARLEGRLDRQLHEPTRLWSGIPAYQAFLGIRIKDGTAAKRLAEEEAKTLLAESDRITGMERKATTGGAKLTAGKALEIAIALEQLSGRIDQSLKDRNMALPKVDNLQSAIDERIGESLLKGGLNTGEARESKSALSRITAVKQGYLGTSQELSPRQTLLIACELQRLYLHIEEQIHDSSAVFPGLDRRRAQIEALVEEGLASGRLSLGEASRIYDHIIESSKLERDCRNSGTMLSAQEAIDLAEALEREYEGVDRRLRERQVTLADLVSLEGSVERKIGHGFCKGLLSLKDAEAARTQYNEIVAAFLKMRVGEGGLSYGERLAFVCGFERLATSIERGMGTTPVLLPNIERHYRDIEQKLAAYLASGRLPMAEARELKDALDDTVGSANRLRSTGGGLSYSEAMVLNGNLRRLAEQVDQRASARKALLDIDGVEAALTKLVKESAAAGKLTKSEAAMLNAELDRIAQCESNYRTSEEGLSFIEALNLMLDLERVQNDLSKLSKKPLKTSPSSRMKPRITQKTTH